MKKILYAIILCGILIVECTGCGKAKNKFIVGEESSIVITNNDVTLSIKDGTLTNKGATLVLKNDSDQDYQYGNPFEIEIKENGKWHKINVELNFTLPAFIIQSGETKEFPLSWENGYGKLASGTYRIIKNVDYQKENGNFERFHVAVEFTIE